MTRDDIVKWAQEAAIMPPDWAVGMELRDYFAAKALPLAMRWVKHNYDLEIGNRWRWNEEEFEDDPKEIAMVAYQIADAMMEERERGKNNGTT